MRSAGYICPISIHSAARAETAEKVNTEVETNTAFQSTPPRGRRLKALFRPPHPAIISIHSAARAETMEEATFKKRLIISIHSAARAETAIIHNNLYYSPSHFHKQII